jgi:hypothetical protein
MAARVPPSCRVRSDMRAVAWGSWRLGMRRTTVGSMCGARVVGLGRRATWPAACVRSREADGEGARLDLRMGHMSGCEAGGEHGRPVRRAWPEGLYHKNGYAFLCPDRNFPFLGVRRRTPDIARAMPRLVLLLWHTSTKPVHCYGAILN